MNAPAKAKDLLQPNVELLPLTSIAPSETKVQAERRKHYNVQALEDLASSIREQGVLMPIVVRPLEALRGLAKYELVAGERRWLASEKARQAHIIARILPLTDAQVLQAQLVENLHREGLDTLAEARGYRELLDTGVNADAIAAMIGLSRSYVYARVKLLELAPAVKTALTEGAIDASQALLFARIPTAKLQEQALNTLRKWDYQGHGEKLSFRRTAEILGDKMKGVLIPLAQVPFRLDDNTFFGFGPKDSRGAQDAINLPTCLACPKRSGNDPELLAAIGDANVCTDKECHDTKAKEAIVRRATQARASGREVLSGDAAAAITPTPYGTRGFVDLDEVCHDDEFPEAEPEPQDGESDEAFDARFDAWDARGEKWQSRTYRQILGEDVGLLEITLVQDPKNKTRLRELAPDKAVAKLLKEKGIKAQIQRDTRKAETPEKPKNPEAARRAEEKAERERAEQELQRKIEEQYETRLFKRVHQAWKGPMKRDDLELVAEYILDECGVAETVEIVYDGKRPSPATMNERDLGRLLITLAIGARLDRGYGDSTRALGAMAKRLKIDPAKVKKEVKAELTPKDEASPAKKPAGKKAKKK